MSSAFEQSLIRFRRDLHRHPESGWTEFRTTVRIIEALTAEGIPVRFGRALHREEHMFGLPETVKLEHAWKRSMDDTGRSDLLQQMRGGFTGCVAEIIGAFPGKTTVFRVDIDACELEESHDGDHFPAKAGFDSVYSGCMHACGHDAHAAIGVGAAKLLWRQREHLHGTVRILFQPAEEGLRGAASMTASGLLDDCDQLIGLHVGIKDLSIGTVAASAEGFLSSTKLDVYFHGKAAHAGICPELGRNAMAAGAEATLQLLKLPDQFDGLCRVNVGTFHAGSGRNVIPAQAHLALETRADSTERNVRLAGAAENVCKLAAAHYACGVELRYMGGANAALCDPSLVQAVANVLHGMPQIKNILPSVSFGGGEDVTTMMHAVQQHGGTATELLIGMPLKAPHHSDRFDIDERVIMLGVQILEQLGLSLGK